MLKRNAVAIAISSLFLAASASAVTIYENDNGDKVQLYGEVGVGGHIGADYEYGEFYADQSFIDDSFATMGVKGKKDKMSFRLELDYERENWKYADGDLVLAIDKLFLGYDLYKNDSASHYVEVGLTDTAFDDYDKWGDFTFDTTVETGEAGDQDMTVKYEGRYLDGIRVGASFTYLGESSSGSELGDLANGYVGYFADRYSVVVGIEDRSGSDGLSKYGEQRLYGIGARVSVTDQIQLGFNAYKEEEDIANISQCIKNCTDGNDENDVNFYNEYETQENQGWLVSGKYKYNENWEFTASYNFEEYEKWEIANRNEQAASGNDKYSWGNEREWGTVGVNYKPTRSTIIALEVNAGEAAQDAYAYARLYF